MSVIHEIELHVCSLTLNLLEVYIMLGEKFSKYIGTLLKIANGKKCAWTNHVNVNNLMFFVGKSA